MKKIASQIRFITLGSIKGSKLKYTQKPPIVTWLLVNSKILSIYAKVFVKENANEANDGTTTHPGTPRTKMRVLNHKRTDHTNKLLSEPNVRWQRDSFPRVKRSHPTHLLEDPGSIILFPFKSILLTLCSQVLHNLLHSLPNKVPSIFLIIT